MKNLAKILGTLGLCALPLSGCNSNNSTQKGVIVNGYDVVDQLPDPKYNDLFVFDVALQDGDTVSARYSRTPISPNHKAGDTVEVEKTPFLGYSIK